MQNTQHPNIKPIKLKEYTVKQSKYTVAGTLPIRSLLIGPSGSGKTILSQNFLIMCSASVSKEYICFLRR